MQVESINFVYKAMASSTGWRTFRQLNVQVCFENGKFLCVKFAIPNYDTLSYVIKSLCQNRTCHILTVLGQVKK